MGEGPLGWDHGGAARLPLPAHRGASGAPARARCADPGADVFEWTVLDFFIITATASPLEAQQLHLSQVSARAIMRSNSRSSCVLTV